MDQASTSAYVIASPTIGRHLLQSNLSTNQYSTRHSKHIC
jgi:hypothetical protein